MHPFATSDARARLQAAAASIESTSALEVVIAVRARVVDGRAPELFGGAILSFAVLLFTLFAPPEFDLVVIAIVDLLAFATGMAVVRAFPPLRRLLVLDRTADAAVLAAARATFIELGVHRTRDRSGVLVFVALEEAQVRIVVDVGVETALGSRLGALVRAIESVGHEDGLDAPAIDRLIAALSALGEAAAPGLPRRSDDRNELGELQ